MQQIAESSSKSRYNYIDILRVFSIFLVIVLHALGDYFYKESSFGSSLWWCLGFTNEFCRTGVPLFFMISGFLLLKEDIPDIKEFYKKRFTKICIPLACYNVFYYVMRSISDGELDIWRFVTETIDSGCAYHLWFMYTLMFLYLMIPFAKKVIDKCSAKTLVGIFVFAIFQTTIKPFINTVSNGYVYIYLNQDGICGYFGYVILGYILGTYDVPKWLKRLIYALAVVSFVAFPVVSMYWAADEGTISLFNGGYSLNHYIEAAALFILFQERINIKIKFISALSVLVMDAYFIHVFILEKFKLLHWEVIPAVMLTALVVITTVLSFLWAFAKHKTIKHFKGVRQNG